MTPIAPHISAFLQQRLPIECGASDNTCESYSYAFKLLFEYASNILKIPPSQLQLEQIDAQLIVDFLGYLETTRGNGPNSRNTRLAAIKSFMHYMEYRVPSALEQIRQVLALPVNENGYAVSVKHLTVRRVDRQFWMLQYQSHGAEFVIAQCFICASPVHCAFPS